MVTEFHGKGVVKGVVTAEVIMIPTSFSFLGDVDMGNGLLLTGENKGMSVQNKILIFTESKGSSGGCVVLLTLVKKKFSPAGLITVKMPDYNLVEGAILGNIPFLSNISPEIFKALHTGDTITLNTTQGTTQGDGSFVSL